MPRATKEELLWAYTITREQIFRRMDKKGMILMKVGNLFMIQYLILCARMRNQFMIMKILSG